MDQFSQIDQIRDLPQRSKTWIVAARRLRSWIQNEDETYVRSHLILIMEKKHGYALGYDLLTEVPQAEAVLQNLLNIMLEPEPSAREEPHRPIRIEFFPHELAHSLRQPLQDLGIKALKAHHTAGINAAMDGFEESSNSDSNNAAGLLSIKGVSPRLVGDFFDAAADFYAAEPWLTLPEDRILAIQTEPDGEPWFIQIIGQEGDPFGLLLFHSLADVELANSTDGPPAGSWYSVPFQPIHSLPFDDLEAIERYGWKVAGEMAYPFPMVFEQKQVLRPPCEELILFEKIMRAVALFVYDHLAGTEADVEQPVEIDLTVPAHTGTAHLHISYPAIELQEEGQPGDFAFSEWDREELREQEDPAILLPDPRAMEGFMFGGSFSDAIDASVQEAQSLMYDAWDESDPQTRIAAAHEALKISPDCADAYVLLAEEETKTLEEAMGHFQAGVKAGERALGKAYFEENAGHFWGLLETRPYMRARQGLAHCLWKLDQTNAARTHYEEMLHLNPDDNQANRYMLMDLYLTNGLNKESLALLERYDDDIDAHLLYAQALTLYRIKGAGAEADQVLRSAIKANPHVPEYLSDPEQRPIPLPEYIIVGEKSDAVAYATIGRKHWHATQGAVEWLREIEKS